jgi:hypothetical protein
MPVIGLNFKSIRAYIDEKKIVEKVDVNSTPQIQNITKKDLGAAGIKDVLSVEFNFVTKYEPRIGKIIITGEVLYQTDDAKRILTMWKDKKLDSKLAVDVLNAIFRKCITKAVQITDDLKLPPPLTFPIVRTDAEAHALTESDDSKKEAAS